MKRVLRELFRTQQTQLPNMDLVIRTQKAFERVNYAEIKQEFEHLLSKLQRQTERIAELDI